MPQERSLINDEVAEAINARPPWILRHGLLLIFCAVCAVLAASGFITYPEIKSVPARIIAADTEGFKVLAKLSEGDLAKVKAGQNVKIKLNSFPYTEYGYLEGIIQDIDKSHTATVAFKNSNVTNTNRKLPLQAELSGTCEIEVERMSIFRRIFRQLFRL